MVSEVKTLQSQGTSGAHNESVGEPGEERMSPGSATVWETRKAGAWSPEDLGRVDLLEGARARRGISRGPAPLPSQMIELQLSFSSHRKVGSGIPTAATA